MAEERGAEGARDEGDGERGQSGRGGIFFREEEARENQDGRGGVNVEIKKLDGGADQAGEKNLGRTVNRAGDRSGVQDSGTAYLKKGESCTGSDGSPGTQNIFVHGVIFGG